MKKYESNHTNAQRNQIAYIVFEQEDAEKKMKHNKQLQRMLDGSKFYKKMKSREG